MNTYAYSILISFVLCTCITYVLIPMLRRLRASNTEREEGVSAHLQKQGTPTMGGIAIVISICATSLIYVHNNKTILPILLVTLGFGIVGFLDDYLKVVLRSSDGLKPLFKLLCELLITTSFLIYIMKFSDISLKLNIPFVKNYVDIGFFAIPLFFIVVLGTVNAVNFTDGVDGLASSVTIVVAIFFCIAATIKHVDFWPICMAVVGSLLGFLLFNSYPAKIFMGDTGSLALGGFVASAAYMLNMPIFIIIIGFIYLMEIFSVIIQVTYFKATHGKRIFKMSPIHHHFELSGWSETRVVFTFSIITAILCCVAFLGI